LHSKWIVVVILAASIAIGCSRQETAWRQAADRDTVTAYEDYLGRFPGGAHSAEARERILKLREAEAWAVAERVRAPEAWQRYLAAWPEGRHASDARRELADFAPIVPAAPIRGHAAQLGAYSSESSARTDLARLLRDPAELLDGRAGRSPRPPPAPRRCGVFAWVRSPNRRPASSARSSSPAASTACRFSADQPVRRRHSARPTSRAWSARPKRFRFVRMTPSVNRVRFV
jgi:hypothetical protein